MLGGRGLIGLEGGVRQNFLSTLSEPLLAVLDSGQSHGHYCVLGAGSTDGQPVARGYRDVRADGGGRWPEIWIPNA